MSDLPTLPLTITARKGRFTTGNAVEDRRLKDGIVFAMEQAAKLHRRLWIYEDPKNGLTLTNTDPYGSRLEVRPGGRVVFRRFFPHLCL